MLARWGFTLDFFFERAPHAGFSTLMSVNEPLMPVNAACLRTREEIFVNAACLRTLWEWSLMLTFFLLLGLCLFLEFFVQQTKGLFFGNPI